MDQLILEPGACDMSDDKIGIGWLLPILLIFVVILFAGFFQTVPILGSILALSFAACVLVLVFKQSWQDAFFTPLKIEDRGKRLTVLILSFLFMVSVPGANEEENTPKPVANTLTESPAPKEPATKETAPTKPTVQLTKPAPKPLIPYRVLDHVINSYKVSYDLEVYLVDGRLPTKDELAAISMRLVGGLNQENKFVGFYLPGMKIDSGYFATGHHQPTLKVEINDWALPDNYLALLYKPEPPKPPAPPAEPKPPYRIWTSANGQSTTVARLIDYTPTTALIAKSDPWKYLSLPINKLSTDDGDFIASDTRQLIIGEVIGIADGDTITIRGNGKNYKIRLDGIDAPEKKQDYGRKATNVLSDLVFRKNVRVRWKEKDRYGCVIGQVIAGGVWVNHQLLLDGWAWHYTDYSSDPDLSEAGRLAREADRGIWANANEPQPPWEFRNPPEPEPELFAPVSKDTPVKSYWLNTSTNARHNRGCRHFENTKQGRYCDADDGKACGICGG